MRQVTAIVPVKDRPTVWETGRSLLAFADLHLLLCDGGSTMPETVAAVMELLQDRRVSRVFLPQKGFNKSQLLNAGLRAARSPWVLLSDADIIWETVAISTLLQQAGQDEICGVADVIESQTQTAAVQRPRRNYCLTWQEQQVELTWTQEVSAGVRRPGCGLLCARRETLAAVGGYKERFQGWGWEDRDLLLRSQLLGMRVRSAASVVHLSHGDIWRNRFTGGIDPRRSRDRNFELSQRELQQGRFWGDLQLAEVDYRQPSFECLHVPPVIVTQEHWQRWI